MGWCEAGEEGRGSERGRNCETHAELVPDGDTDFDSSIAGNQLLCQTISNCTTK